MCWLAGVPFIPTLMSPPRAGYGRREGPWMTSYDSAPPRYLTLAFKVSRWLHTWPDIDVKVLYINPSGTKKGGGGETILRQRGQTLGIWQLIQVVDLSLQHYSKY